MNAFKIAGKPGAVAPGASSPTDSLAQLLGAFGFRWLTACATYPVLRLPITLYIGAALRRADHLPPPTEAEAAALGALPWFRQGWMPSALRASLLEMQTADDRATTARALADLAHTMLDAPAADNWGGVAIATPTPAPKDFWLKWDAWRRGLPGIVAQGDAHFNAIVAPPRTARRALAGLTCSLILAIGACWWAAAPVKPAPNPPGPVKPVTAATERELISAVAAPKIIPASKPPQPPQPPPAQTEISQPPPPNSSVLQYIHSDTDAINFLIELEGGYSAGAGPEGASNFGITQADLGQYRGAPASAEDIRNLPVETARAIYQSMYLGGNVAKIENVQVRAVYLALAVSVGQSRAVMIFQQAAEKLSNKFISEDGFLGPATVALINTIKPYQFIDTVNCDAAAFYQALPQYQQFGAWWTRRLLEFSPDSATSACPDLLPPAESK